MKSSNFLKRKNRHYCWWITWRQTMNTHTVTVSPQTKNHTPVQDTVIQKKSTSTNITKKKTKRKKWCFEDDIDEKINYDKYKLIPIRTWTSLHTLYTSLDVLSMFAYSLDFLSTLPPLPHLDNIFSTHRVYWLKCKTKFCELIDFNCEEYISKYIYIYILRWWWQRRKIWLPEELLLPLANRQKID